MSDLDTEKFRLRRFVDKLAGIGEVEVHDEPVALADMSGDHRGERTRRCCSAMPGRSGWRSSAAWSASRARFAAAFGVDERAITGEVMRRLGNPQQAVEIPSADAPVQQVVLTGDDVDLTTLPFHLQHEHDGGCYISSGLDFTIDPATGKRNVGCRRLMLRGRREMRTNLTDNSDLKGIYLARARAQGAAADRLRRRHQPDRFLRRQPEGAGRRARPAGDAARRGDAGRQMHDERHSACRPTPRS